LLQDAGLADINIIAEKTAFEGLTRFEDKERLPLGTNFNLTAYGANMLLQAAVSPKVVPSTGHLQGARNLYLALLLLLFAEGSKLEHLLSFPCYQQYVGTSGDK
jgi:hypothetical protein